METAGQAAATSGKMPYFIQFVLYYLSYVHCIHFFSIMCVLYTVNSWYYDTMYAE